MPVQMPYLSPELEQESEDVQRKRRIADALLARGLQPAEGQMLGRVYVPPNTLNSAINAIGGTLLAKKYQGQSADIAARGAAQQQSEIERIANALHPPMKTIQPDPQEAQQSADYGTPAVAPAQVQTQTPQQALEGVLPSLRTPFGQHLAQGYLGGQISQLGPTKPMVVGKSLVDPRTNKVLVTDPSVAAENKAKLDEAAARQASEQAFRNDQARQAAADRVALMRATQEAKKTPGKLPPATLREQNDLLEGMGIAGNLNSDIGTVLKQLNPSQDKSGKEVPPSLQLNPYNNAVSNLRNAIGKSTEQSRNFGTFKATLEKLRNDSLRLNKGVQTEGDAVRAWNEILANINDQEYVKKRLADVQEINQRAVRQKQMQIDILRNNFGLDPLDTSAIAGQPSAIDPTNRGGASTSGWGIKPIP